MDIKLICTDIDGTLIGDGRRGIPQINKTMLQKATAMGIPVALVSGRGPGGIRPLLEDCGIRGAMGCFSGALVLDEDGKELFGCPMEKPLALQVLAEIRNVTNVTVFSSAKRPGTKNNRADGKTSRRKSPASESAIHPSRNPSRTLPPRSTSCLP